MNYPCRIWNLSSATLLASMIAFGSIGHADAGPCDTADLKGGKVELGAPLPAALPLASETSECLRAAAKTLVDRPLLRIVTVVAFVTPEQLRAKQGLAVGEAMKKVLVEAGVPARQVSFVSRAAGGPGRDAGVQLTYRERPAGRPVAKVLRVDGSAANGLRLQKLQAAKAGTPLRKYEYLQNEAATRTVARLPDGSKLRVEPATLLRFHQARLNKDYKREIEIEVLKGTVKTLATHEDGSSFRIVTKSAVAAVKGTRFATTVAEDGTTRIEVIDGKVDLGNDKSSVAVAAGFGSRVGADGVPEAPRALLPRAVGQRPILGTFAAPPTVSWDAVAGAEGGYVVEFAANAEFTKQVSDVVVAPGTTSAAPDASLGPQRWFWRVQAIDADGFRGMPSKIFAFDLKPAKTAEPGQPAS